MNTPKILLFGQTGQVAFELQRTLATMGNVIVASRTSPQLQADLTDLDSVRAAIQEARPTHIINAAAYTAVDAAEEDEATAMLVNGTAPGLIAEEAKRLGAAVIHYSTDYVFDGAASAPYTEAAPTAPLGVYGKTKLAGEQGIQQSGADHLIFRTAWVYGNRGKNFLQTIRRLANEREELTIVNDQMGSPTWSRHIAEATAQVLAQTLTTAERLHASSGIYHMTSAGQCSWYDFAQAIVTAIPEEHRQCRSVQPIPSSAFPTPAARPAYSVLSGEKLTTTFGIRMPRWEAALSLCMAEAM